MNRREALVVLTKYRGDSPAIVGPSVGGRLLYEIDPRPATLYNMELGYPAAMCLGLALALPGERVFALEGDGSMLAGLGVLTTIARYRPKNLIVFVMDNRRYVTAGSLDSATASGADLAAIGRGAGIEQTVRVSDPVALDDALQRATTTDGPFLIVADVDPEDFATLGTYRAMPFDIVESAVRFRRHLEDRGLVPTLWAI